MVLLPAPDTPPLAVGRASLLLTTVNNNFSETTNLYKKGFEINTDYWTALSGLVCTYGR